jgi:hypothetical protein
MSSTYIATTVDQDDSDLQQHLVANSGGLCLTCGEREPCIRRQILARLLAGSGRLPRRRPGVLGRAVFKAARRYDGAGHRGQRGCAVVVDPKADVVVDPRADVVVDPKAEDQDGDSDGQDLVRSGLWPVDAGR